MEATTVVLNWPEPSDAASASSIGAAADRRWSLRRNCSIAPRQLCQAYLLLCGVGLFIGLMFWWLGFGIVLAFAGLELAALALALLIHARHVADGELVVLKGRFLEVEVQDGADTRRAAFPLDRVRVEVPRRPHEPMMIRDPGQCLGIGRHVPAHRRAAIAQELRSAVRAAQHGTNAEPKVLELMRR